MALRLFYRPGLSTTITFRNHRFVKKNECFLSYLKEGKVAIRLANAGDFDEIVKLSKRIEDRFDYVPYRFHKWLAAPNRITMVAEKETKVVGFIGCSVVDRKESMVLDAARVDPNHRHQGIYSSLIKFGIEQTREEFPTVARLRYSLWSGMYKAVRNAILKLQLEDKEVQCYDFLTYKVEPKRVNFGFKLQNFSKIVPCTKNAFQKRILDNAGTTALFSNNILVIDWHPFEAIPSNIEDIMSQQDRYLIDLSGGCHGNLTPSSFSLGRFVQLDSGMLWTSTIYAKDLKLCQSHVIHQLMSACQTAQRSFLFSTYQDPSLTEYCKEALKDFPSVKSMRNGESIQKMYILEADLSGWRHHDL
ncbi:histidine N-acetyltransferase-like [Stylophora pistillata]|nr:histidine N-acetyltransferase-like [Stylophora pistillata]